MMEGFRGEEVGLVLGGGRWSLGEMDGEETVPKGPGRRRYLD